jgi:hypothetical protein
LSAAAPAEIKRYEGTCKGGPMNGQRLVMEHQDYCTVYKHPGEFVGVYKFKQGYEGYWIWIEK